VSALRAEPRALVETALTDGWSVCRFDLDAGYRMSRHGHRHPGLVLGLRGSWHASTSRGDHHVEPGRALVLPDDLPHAERTGGAGAQVLLLCREAGGDGARPAPRELRAVSRPGLAALASMLALSLRSRDAAAGLAAEEILHALLDLAGWGGDRASSPPAWLRRVRERIHDELPDRPALGDLAEDAGVSREHLARAFRRAEGRSIGAYLRAARLDRAAAELRDTDRPIAEIALRCGFADQSHLTRAFRWRFRQPPGAFRARWRSAAPAPPDRPAPSSRTSGPPASHLERSE
jgi:AraC family transcriptional regulator